MLQENKDSHTILMLEYFDKTFLQDDFVIKNLQFSLLKLNQQFYF